MYTIGNVVEKRLCYRYTECILIYYVYKRNDYFSKTTVFLNSKNFDQSMEKLSIMKRVLSHVARLFVSAWLNCVRERKPRVCSHIQVVLIVCSCPAKLRECIIPVCARVFVHTYVTGTYV